MNVNCGRKKFYVPDMRRTRRVEIQLLAASLIGTGMHQTSAFEVVSRFIENIGATARGHNSGSILSRIRSLEYGTISAAAEHDAATVRVFIAIARDSYVFDAGDIQECHLGTDFDPHRSACAGGVQ
jgi:hypothetical protein